MHLAILAIGNRYALLITRLAVEAESRSIESLWFGDHSCIPANRHDAADHATGIVTRVAAVSLAGLFH